MAPLEDYALIGDMHTAALVGRDGSIDWLCFPRFDSGACFAALLGTPDHGRWLIAPRDAVQSTRRRYREGSLVLETEFSTGSGVIRVSDCMPPRQAEPDLVRVVEGISGEVAMRMELIIRFDYGSIVPWVRTVDGVLRAVGGPDSVLLWSPIETKGVGLTTQAEFTVRAGDRVPFVLMWHPSHEPAPKPIDGLNALDDTERWWRAWSDRCTYQGPWRDQVMRSAITLKALTYAPTGGLVAAPTTSLPECLGGARNWDYRFCWLRDATFSLYALLNCGFTEEAAAWRDWLLRAAAGAPETLQTMYGPAGERRLSELELPWLPGYEDSRPVRIGNAAFAQRQLDVYGEVMDALYVARRTELDAEGAAWRVQTALLEFLEQAWHDPDEGIWEVRGPRRHFTHSKVLAWVAFDRALKMIERFGVDGPRARWHSVRQQLHDEICARGYDPQRQTFTQYYGSRELDASLLLLPLVGFLPPDDLRIRGTVAAIERELMHEGFVRRYCPSSSGKVDGLADDEGMFLPCTFWLVDNYVLQGRREEGQRIFEQLLSVANDVGLLAEEYSPHENRLLGNFPQLFSHVALINTAHNLTRESGPAEHRRKA